MTEKPQEELNEGPLPVRSQDKPKDVEGYVWRVTQRNPEKGYAEVWTPFKKFDPEDPNNVPNIDEVPPTGLEGVKLSKDKPEVKNEPEPPKATETPKEAKTDSYTKWINEH